MGWFDAPRIRPPPPLRPIRSELFGVERLEQHAESLAAAQSVLPGSVKGRPLLRRVDENGRALRAAYRAITQAIRDKRPTTPAAEWLADNFHVVEEQVREIRDDLPPGFYRLLPKLAEGPLAGFPRVYGIAWAYVAHTDSRFVPENLRSFLLAYQRVVPLTIGELWAVAITLRVVLVENLRRLADAIVRANADRVDADADADALLGLVDDAAPPIHAVPTPASAAPLRPAYAVQLVRRLRDRDPAVTPALDWLDRRLAAQGTTSEEIVRLEHRRQAEMNSTVRNVITGMALMSALDWSEFFESVSHVDHLLRADADYAAMDFATRDGYRHAVEDVARRSGRDEPDVVRRTFELAARSEVRDGRRDGPGFYLVGDGRRTLEKSLGARDSVPRSFLRAYLAAAPIGYPGTIALFTGALLAAPLVTASASGAGVAVLLALALLAAVPASDLAVALVNRVVVAMVKPRLLPRFELRGGVPRSMRTLVVVPTMLTSPEDVEAQIELMEVHFLSNPDGDVRFALLSDWTDAPAETVSNDADLLAVARRGVAALNRRHGRASEGDERFFLFHRRRLWNASEGVWMGWERKRGKLHELNRLLRGASDTSFLLPDGDGPSAPRDVRYVVTLDSDTRMPRGAVDLLVGAMAHPLNRPRFDERSGRVVEGYGVLQPRITPPLPGGRRSLFQSLTSGPSGIDPYAAAVSDVYQDLFGEGSYTGKGIYDVDAFQSALAGRTPDNALLSHDLFEGVFARAGLVTDVEFFEGAPSHYGVAAARQHRWARGDWQLLPWILRPGLPFVGRWKMVDNLRRTLSAPAAFSTLIVAWCAPGASAFVWAAFILATIAGPPLLPAVNGMIPRRRGISKRSHLRAVGRDYVAFAIRASFSVATLPHQAWLMGDAVVRTLVRVYATRRNLLEWVTAAASLSRHDLELGSFYRRMAGGVALALVGCAFVATFRPEVLVFVWPIFTLWIFAPVAALRASAPRRVALPAARTPADSRFLRSVALRTWRYFTTFVSADDFWLPPDNFQEDPKPVVARRTSPTNMGLYLLSIATARDFGWIGAVETLERIEATLGSMKSLERFRGHFFNWYDTSDKRPLDPRYVSSVDSGNLAAHLVAFGNACREYADRGVPPETALAGMEDAALVVRESAGAAPAVGMFDSNAPDALDLALRDFLSAVRLAPDFTAWPARMRLLVERARAVLVAARTRFERSGDDATSAARVERVYDDARALMSIVESHARDLSIDAASADESSERMRLAATDADALSKGMEFAFLFDPIRKLFAIGYRATEGELDAGRYDLLASEARLTSFLAIAGGHVPVSHWFRLGRALTPVARDSVLVSWSGSMFEYLMPSLVLRAPLGSLLDQTCRLVVRRQISYGVERGVPWGVSESAYYVRDLEMTYQYSNFGVPGLGFRRGLADDVVVAPYATALAAMFDPAEAVRNFRRIDAIGGRGAYGYYEAIDFTPSRLPLGADTAVVRAYMAHHQGMSLVALNNVVHDGVMRDRYHLDAAVVATDLLLQERTPRDVAIARPPAEASTAIGEARAFVPPVERRFTTPHGAAPRTHVLSNGRYSVLLTGAGSGYSRWRDMAITRWREDVTRDVGGTYFYLRDLQNGSLWSAGFQPVGAEPDEYEVVFNEDRARVTRRDGSLVTSLDVVVSPEDDAEVRRVSIMNSGARAREIELTSYAEVVLTSPAADAAHPAFSNLFVRTECVPELETLLATRRTRSPDETAFWLAHVLVVDGETIGDLEWETDRARFVGRGRGPRAPAAAASDAALSGTVGPVLDPIVALRRRVRVAPGATVRVSFTTLVARTREEALSLAEKYRDPSAFDRVATLAWTNARVQLRHLGVDEDEAHLFQSLARRVLFVDRTLRAPSDVLARAEGGPPALWVHGVSGDVPIVLLQIDDPADVGVVRQLLRAHEYWRLKGLAVDLVILNERAPSYVQDLQTLLETTVRANRAAAGRDKHDPRGAVFVLRADHMSHVRRDALLAASRAMLSNRRGTLSEQLSRDRRRDAAPPKTPRPTPARTPRVESSDLAAALALESFNGYGGFADDGREYVTILEGGRSTPAPWINVVANPTFGFQASETGAGYTWSSNSRENQLTPWSNDPVCDPPGEAFYIRDLDAGVVWSPTASPIRERDGTYVARHGQGWSRFAREAHGVSAELLQYVPKDDAIKISRLSLKNVSGRVLRLSATAYVEWVLGASRVASAPFIVTESDSQTRALFARNTWNADFPGRVAFLDLCGAQTEWTGDRTEFIGRNGDLARPAALERNNLLSGRTGADLDPCGALRTRVELRDGERAEIVCFLGEASTRAEAAELIARYRTADLDAIFHDVEARWESTLGAIHVKTPDRATDILLNRRLLHQTLACRVWSRSAFYQAGGAYGYRDQLQDVMALCTAAPDVARAHLLRAASRQFVEGDVQHWWHPPTGRGVRTRISDDALWLPFAARRYFDVVGDAGVFDELVPFLEGPTLADDQEESYFQPGVSSERASLYEHCARALDRALVVGPRGLPLIGTGDWNDGMNRVGSKGRGESVWLAWFLASTLLKFAEVAEQRGDGGRAEIWRGHAKALALAAETHAWDGDWYRRAYFDDGTPLGTRDGDACAIDAIAQSWAVISGLADRTRAARAMQAVDERLVRRADGLVVLLTPPFDRTPLEPGYIKGYPPGVRENGGQYTHAAAWTIIAFAELGDGDKAHELFALVNPINHTTDVEGVKRYRVEPYVLAGDVYSEAPHVGRGGWTWYTGSAGWMYQAGVEHLLGIRLRGEFLHLDPCIPRRWPRFDVSIRFGSSRYDVAVENPDGVSRGVVSLSLDGAPPPSGTGPLRLVDDGGDHVVRAVMG